MKAKTAYIVAGGTLALLALAWALQQTDMVAVLRRMHGQ
jgi:hypothetical protein